MKYARKTILLVAFLLFTGCVAVDRLKEPSVSLSDLRMLDGTVFEQRMLIVLRLGNPNNVDLAIDGLTFNLEVNGEELAEGYSKDAVTIPRLGQVVVRVIATTTLLDMVRQAIALGRTTELTYRMTGDVYLKGGFGRSVGYEKKGTLNLIPNSGGRYQPAPGIE